MRRIWHGPRDVGEALADAHEHDARQAALARHPATLHQQVPALADVVDMADWKARKGER